MKSNSSIENLAVYGGSPIFSEPLHVGRPNIGGRDGFLERVNDLLDRRWLTNKGPFVQEFEHRIADFLGVKHCIAMSNGTAALEIAIRALGLHGEVIVPSFTFIATAHALQWQEITPVFCDIDPDTYLIDPASVEALITPRTTGIIGVHTWGRPCPVEVLSDIAEKHHLKLLFDAAHAFGCSYKGKTIGSFGHAEVFSFHATKVLNTFEGGAVTTNDDDLAAKIRLMKNFGFAGRDNVIHIGTNGKMSEISAAMGLSGLESYKSFIEANYRNYQCYRQELSDIPGINMLLYDESEANNFHYIILEVDEKQTGIHRDQIVDVLRAENVLARRYFYPGCHNMEPYGSLFPHAGLLLPQTERLVQRTMALPTGTAVDPHAIQQICALIRLVVTNSAAITEQLKAARI